MSIGKLCPKCGAPQAKCPGHRKKPKLTAAQRGYDARWAAFAKRFLATRPYCEHESGCSEKAVHVHHRDDLGPRGPRGYDPDNLQPLCHSHHSQVTQELRRAKASQSQGGHIGEGPWLR